MSLIATAIVAIGSALISDGINSDRAQYILLLEFPGIVKFTQGSQQDLTAGIIREIQNLAKILRVTIDDIEILPDLFDDRNLRVDEHESFAKITSPIADKNHSYWAALRLSRSPEDLPIREDQASLVQRPSEFDINPEYDDIHGRMAAFLDQNMDLGFNFNIDVIAVTRPGLPGLDVTLEPWVATARMSRALNERMPWDVALIGMYDEVRQQSDSWIPLRTYMQRHP